MHVHSPSLLAIAAVLVPVLPAALALEATAKLYPRQAYFTAPTNATGSVPIKSFNLNKPYPGDWDDPSDPAQTWRLTINVTNEGKPTSSNFAGINVMLRPPELGSPGALIQFATLNDIYNDIYNNNGTAASNDNRPEWIGNTTANADWRMMAVHFEYQELRTVSDGNNMTDGSCPASVLSDDCMRDMRAYVRANPGSAFNVGVPGTGYSPIMSNVKSCEGYTKGEYGREFHPLLSSFPAVYRLVSIRNAQLTILCCSGRTEIPLNKNFTQEAQWVYSFGSKDGLEAYNKYGGVTFPIMLVWANAAVRDDQGFPTFDDKHVTFACVKADTLQGENSTLPTGEGSGGGQPANGASGLSVGQRALGWVGMVVLGFALVS